MEHKTDKVYKGGKSMFIDLPTSFRYSKNNKDYAVFTKERAKNCRKTGYTQLIIGKVHKNSRENRGAKRQAFRREGNSPQVAKKDECTF